MSNLYSLDTVKGTLTLLQVLGFDRRPIERLELLTEMRKKNIGRAAVYRSINTLVELGLIVVKQSVSDGKRVVCTYPSERGFRVIEKIEEIIKIMDEKENVPDPST